VQKIKDSVGGGTLASKFRSALDMLRSLPANGEFSSAVLNAAAEELLSAIAALREGDLLLFARTVALPLPDFSESAENRMDAMRVHAATSVMLAFNDYIRGDVVAVRDPHAARQWGDRLMRESHFLRGDAALRLFGLMAERNFLVINTFRFCCVWFRSFICRRRFFSVCVCSDARAGVGRVRQVLQDWGAQGGRRCPRL